MNSQNITTLHKELLELNLSISAYVEESKKRLAGLRLEAAHDAKSSHQVVEILSEKCECFFICLHYELFWEEAYVPAVKMLRADSVIKNNIDIIFGQFIGVLFL